MKKRAIGTLILLVAAVSFSSCGYNVMQGNEEAVNKAWADIDSQLQRRADLIPNLVETVKAYAKHEKETLTAVIEARAKATSIQLKAENLGDAQAMERYAKAQGELGSALSRLMVVVEKYPNLKANENFRDLQHQLEGTENRISVARQRYNKAVETFNYSIRSFPNSLTNSLLLKLQKKEYFKAEGEARTAPKVQF
ncbi:MAG TPA: LemA family protein [Spirochaetota bacterium]|nr:LemA family protein [Spirochaetota bacterium]